MSEIEMPKLLYKYRKLRDGDGKLDGNTRKILQDGEIYFATLDKLSDDFEYAFIWYRDEYVILTDERLKYFKKHHVGSNKNLVKLTRNEYTEYMMNSIRRNQPYGILSLSGSGQNPYMWDRYAGGNTGICIGFDWEGFNLEFANSSPPVKNKPRKVLYVPEPLEISGKPDEWIDVFNSKWKAYAHEDEWRMFYKKGPYKSEDVRLSIKEILFGSDVSEQDRELVKELVSDLDDIRFLEIERRYDQYEYGIIPYEVLDEVE